MLSKLNYYLKLNGFIDVTFGITILVRVTAILWHIVTKFLVLLPLPLTFSYLFSILLLLSYFLTVLRKHQIIYELSALKGNYIKDIICSYRIITVFIYQDSYFTSFNNTFRNFIKMFSLLRSRCWNLLIQKLLLNQNPTYTHKIPLVFHLEYVDWLIAGVVGWKIHPPSTYQSPQTCPYSNSWSCDCECNLLWQKGLFMYDFISLDGLPRIILGYWGGLIITTSLYEGLEMSQSQKTCWCDDGSRD